MALRPIGHRILVKPDDADRERDSGLVIPDTVEHVPCSGTVVALGPGGSAVRYGARQRALDAALEFVDSGLRQFGRLAALTIVRENIAGLRGSADSEREIAVGDRVVFTATDGLTVHEDGEAYILLDEDAVVVICDDVEAAA